MATTPEAYRPRASSIIEQSRGASNADPLFRRALTALAGSVLVLIAGFFLFLLIQAWPGIKHQGLSFIYKDDWNPSQGVFGAWPMVAGTLITSAIALVIGVPVAVATALFVTELAPKKARTPLIILIELLAAVPSVVYGLWGLFVLAPHLKGFEEHIGKWFGFLPFVDDHVVQTNYFIAGLILAIMILPIVSAISREVISTVPLDHKEAALALGATRWEMMRMAILPYSRAGITGAAMLGLGRAIGETIAVAILIGNASTVGHSIFQQGYSLAAVIANEFGEASNKETYRGALIFAGLVLFLLTLAINAFARGLVVRAERGKRAPEPTAAAAAPAATPGASL